MTINLILHSKTNLIRNVLKVFSQLLTNSNNLAEFECLKMRSKNWPRRKVSEDPSVTLKK